MSLFEQLDVHKRKVDYNTYDISVKELISMVKDGYIDVSPNYQRHFRWDIGRQSTLIESVFLGIPIPSLYMATNSDGTWEVVDGVQRLSTLIHFAGDNVTRAKLNLKDSLKIDKLEKLTDLNNLDFEKLDKGMQNNFLLKPLKITTLSDKSDLSVRFDLFERLNTGGIVLSNQEIRNCIYKGEFSDFLEKMSQDEHFNRVVITPTRSGHDGSREEMILRFFAYLDNYMNFDHSVIGFLNEFMFKSTSKFNYKDREKLFKRTFEALDEALPDGIIRGRKTTPVNLFEAAAVGTALAIRRQASLNFDGLADFLQSDEIKKYTSGATNSRTQVINRIENVRDFLLR